MKFLSWGSAPDPINPLSDNSVSRAICVYGAQYTIDDELKQQQLWPGSKPIDQFFKDNEKLIEELASSEPLDPAHPARIIGMQFGQLPHTQMDFGRESGFGGFNRVVQPHVAILHQGSGDTGSFTSIPRGDGWHDLGFYKVQLRVIGYDAYGSPADMLMPIARVRVTLEQQFFLFPAEPS